MGVDTYESIQKKLWDIEEEDYQNEKLRKRLQEEEDTWYQDGWFIEQNRELSLYRVQDAKTLRLLQEQQEDFQKMQKKRVRFMEAGMEKLAQRKRELESLKEECYLGMRRIRKEDMESGGVRHGEMH